MVCSDWQGGADTEIATQFTLCLNSPPRKKNAKNDNVHNRAMHLITNNNHKTYKSLPILLRRKSRRSVKCGGQWVLLTRLINH